MRRPDKSEGKLLLDLEVEQEFTCLIEKATRTEQKGSITTSTLIDILLTNNIYWTLKEKLPRQPSKVITFRSYKNVDCNKFTWDLSEAPWHVGEILTTWMTKSTTGTLILLMRIFPQRKWGWEQRMCHIWQQIGRTLLELRERHSQISTCTSDSNWDKQRKCHNEAKRQRQRAIKSCWRDKSNLLKENPADFYRTFMPFLSSKASKKGPN